MDEDERKSAGLRIDTGGSAVSQYRDRIFYTLAIVATVVVLPFAVQNLFVGFWAIGLTAIAVVAVLVTDAIAIYRKRQPPLPMSIAFALIVGGVVLAVWQRGLMSVFWTYPAILLFHFVLERRVANAFNIALVALIAIGISPAVELGLGLRIVATQLLTIAFTNIFSYAVEAESRKENEQRRRLNLLVRATQAGFFQWEREGNRATYSGRLKEMLGHPADADTAAWPPFNELIHPADRERRTQLFRDGARARAEPGGVRRHHPGEYRLLHASGAILWVHVEGLFIHGPDGRAARYIASLFDVTDRRRQQEELRSSHERIEFQAEQLRDQNEELRAAIRMREEVERIARHDIKTPLNSIVAVPRLLRERRPLDAREEELLGMVERAAYRILDMVNLSVDLYRMEQGQYRFTPRAVDLAALAQTVAREIGAHARTKGVSFVLPGAPALAWAEELLCYSILANLMKNAVEASPDGAVVTVSAATHADRVVLGVHNAGVVPEEVRGMFFQKYATSGKAGGSGLGAYSARLMSRVQEGDLAMRTSPAQGTTLELALRAVPAGAATGRPAGETAATPAPAPLPALRVLVVDDDEFNVMFVRSGLPSPPLVVDTAINGRAALEVARRDPPDVVLMDLEMPVMDGFEALAGLRAADARTGRRTTVIAFSSHDDEVTRERCAQAGFDAYLPKPAPRERIHQMLLDAVAGRPLADAAPAAPAAQASDPVLIDAELSATMPEFLETRRALGATLADAIGRGDREHARRTAHKLAGSLSLYGFRWAAATARAIEREALAGAPDELASRCEALREHLASVEVRTAAA
jgi:PAS domain S-box-containing protein